MFCIVPIFIVSSISILLKLVINTNESILFIVECLFTTKLPTKRILNNILKYIEGVKNYKSIFSVTERQHHVICVKKKSKNSIIILFFLALLSYYCHK